MYPELPMGSASQDDRDDSDDEEYDEAGGGNRLLGFMFGNVDNSGELEVDYLDEDAKEHLDALADKLGPSLTDIDLSGKSSQTPAAAEEDYDEKAEDAVDYEDFDEQYEGPEIDTATEADHLLSKKEFLSVGVTATTLDTPIFDDENYDEYDIIEDKPGDVVHESEVGTVAVLDVALIPGCEGKVMQEDTNLVAHELLEQPTNDTAVSREEICSEPLVVSAPLQTDSSASLTELQKEEPSSSHDVADVKSLPPLPVLCVENGMTVLRFSEIFGVNEPLKKAGGREHKYSVCKDKFISLDASLMVEEDEEAFLKGCTPSISGRKPLVEAEDEHADDMDDDSECARFNLLDRMSGLHDVRKGSCLTAEPMRKDSVLDLSVEWQSCMSKEFYSLDQQDWEDRIAWGNSPAVSENSMESCELSGPDAESVVHEEKEMTSKAGYSLPDCRVLLDEENNCSQVGLSTVVVEPFDSRESVGLASTSCAESLHHPQLLRLESRLALESSTISDAREGRCEDHQSLDFMKRFEVLALQNKDLIDGSWIDNVMWESQKPLRKPKLILDLQDEKMVFEILDHNNYADLQAHAGAMITTRVGSTGADVFELPGHVALSGGRFDIANDKFYSSRKMSPQLRSLSKKRPSHSVEVPHSDPALMLLTMKLKLSNKDIANFHRPKAAWYPRDNMVAVKDLEKLPTHGPMKVILKSLGGKGSKIQVEAEETIASFKAKASKKLDFKVVEPVKIFYLGKELEDQKSFAEQNVRPNSLLHLSRTKIHLLPMAQKLPNENKSLCPPRAFKKKSDLSIKDGHAFLMEYCEERPLLLGNAGMSARLCTFYQKLSSDDQTGDLLRNEKNGLGTVLTLDPAHKSPFLGDIKPGCSQTCLETSMYKAPAFLHRIASTDYLLVRSAKGKLSIRRIDKLYVVGQQEPRIEVMVPGNKSVQNHLMNRLSVYMYRSFRAAEKRGMHPCIRVDELSAQFPNIHEPFLRKRLKQCADLQKKGPNGLFHWVMKRNCRIPSETELRKLVKPEDVCAYESMLAGLYRLKRLGITRLAYVTGPTQLAALSSAMNQLPDNAIALAAASHIERELQITPWNLSINFVACNRQPDRGNIERLEISGVGDPSGRGLGFSYVRVAPKPPISNAMVKKKPVVAKGSTVTGTDADLRRLSMGDAREVLLKFKVPDEDIEKLSRWHRIALIRKLSSEQAASGVKVDQTTINKYARGQRMSIPQFQQQTRQKCQDIWDRQIQSLTAIDGDGNESDCEANSDLDSFAGDLENLLDAEEGEEGEESSLEMKTCKSDGVKGLKMRRHSPQTRPEEEEDDEKAEASELCRILTDDDGARWKKKKKSKSNGKSAGVLRGPQLNFGIELIQQVKNPNSLVKDIEVPAVANDVLSTKQSTELEEAEKLHSRKTTYAKTKSAKKIDVVPVDILNKKVKIMSAPDGGIKVFNVKKSARDSFVCGACGQLGHMRTNKHCPKYREDPEAQINNIYLEDESTKPFPEDPSLSQQQVSGMKLMPKIMPNVAQAEGAEEQKSTSKTKILKVKYASADRAADKVASVVSLSPEQPSTSEAEVGNKPKPVPKVLKIITNKKPDDTQVESQKFNVVIKPPSYSKREHHHKRITIKQPKKEVINLDQTSEEGPDMESRKTKKMNELAGYGSFRQQDGNLLYEEEDRKRQAAGRMWEEEEKRRIREQIRQQQAGRLFEEDVRMMEYNESWAEPSTYEEVIHRERKGEEFRKANKKIKIKKRTTESRDKYFESCQTRRNNGSLPGRDRSAKRKSIVDLGKYGAEYVPPKRRRGGEVNLANTLEIIVETLKTRREVSFLFLKPVTKKEAPDYLDIVQYPMDLSTIKEKIRHLEYKNREQFRADVCQITYNAHLYNDRRNPGIPPLADQLLEICDYLLQEHAESLDVAEACIEDI